MTEIQEVCAATDEIMRSNTTLQKSNEELLTNLNEVNKRVECVIYINISRIRSVCFCLQHPSVHHTSVFHHINSSRCLIEGYSFHCF